VDDGAARMVGSGSGRGKRGKRGKRRGHRHENGHEHEHEHGDGRGDKSVDGKRRPSPNAYERMPKRSVKRDLKR
jgi:protein phosphatase 1 regulatory subunit 11